jgi:hypothetical protein
MSDPVPATLATPNPSLILSYEEGLHYVQHQLASLIHGALKPWAQEQKLNYSMIVNVKNGRISRPMPRLVQKLLAALGFELPAKRVRKDAAFVVVFIFRDAEQMKLFRSLAST